MKKKNSPASIALLQPQRDGEIGFPPPTAALSTGDRLPASGGG
jgi:hypothetical protein